MEDEEEYDSENDSQDEEVKEELRDLKDSEDEEDVYGEKADKKQDDDDQEEEIDEIRVGAKRQREAENQAKDLRKLKRQKRTKFVNYYRGTFYGKCSASVIYNLCTQLNKENKDMLWWWIVGMTDLIIHNKMGVFDQDEDIGKCNDEVQRLNPHIYNNLDAQPTTEEEQREAAQDLFNLVNLQTQNKEIGTIMMD